MIHVVVVKSNSNKNSAINIAISENNNHGSNGAIEPMIHATAHNSKQRQFKKVWYPLYTQCSLKLLITLIIVLVATDTRQWNGSRIIKTNITNQ